MALDVEGLRGDIFEAAGYRDRGLLLSRLEQLNRLLGPPLQVKRHG